MKKTWKLSKRERRVIKNAVLQQWQEGEKPVPDVIEHAEMVARLFSRLNRRSLKD